MYRAYDTVTEWSGPVRDTIQAAERDAVDHNKACAQPGRPGNASYGSAIVVTRDPDTSSDRCVDLDGRPVWPPSGRTHGSARWGVSDEPEITLYEKSNVYVTIAAADQYAAARGLRQEEARRELTTLMLDATEQTDGSWRRRNKSRNVDISARVDLTDDLAIVTHIEVRGSSVKARAVRSGKAKSEARRDGGAARKPEKNQASTEPRPR